MSRVVEVGDMKIIEFSPEYIEDYMNLGDRNGVKDPQYPMSAPREERKSRILRQVSTGVIKAHFIALHAGKVAGFARAIAPPTCGDAKDRAILVLIVSQEQRNRGIESALLERICEELSSKNIEWIEMGILDSMLDQRAFLEENGFERFEEASGLVLRPNVAVQDLPPLPDITIRTVQFPEDRAGVIELFRGERAEDAPRSCDIIEPWWEVEPFASIFDPEGFFVAEETTSGDIVGFVDAWFYEEGGIRADIGENEVARRYLGTRLRDRILVRAVNWLRGKGGDEIRTRIHVGYRNEEDLFERLGFEIEYTASNWRKRTH